MSCTLNPFVNYFKRYNYMNEIVAKLKNHGFSGSDLFYDSESFMVELDDAEQVIGYSRLSILHHRGKHST
jgi:uncharacterized protein (UPF0332 family)